MRNDAVYVVRCEQYSLVREKFSDLAGLMGGMEQIVHRGERIAVKVNLLRAAKPEKAATTHPEVVAAAGELLKKCGALPLIVDSPGAGFMYAKKVLERIYRICGIEEAAKAAEIRMNFDTSYEIVSHSSGLLAKRFEIITPILNADAVFNIAKLKTHGFTQMTGAVKNIFGVIPGLSKPGYHAKLLTADRFSAMLLDLAACISPRLSILDAVVAMEGDGPGAGRPIKTGFLLGSSNPVALDAVAGEIIGLPWQSNPILIEAEKRGCRPNRIEDIEVIGVDKKVLRVRNFKLARTSAPSNGFGGRYAFLKKLAIPVMKSMMSAKPRVNPKKCIGCGACEKACPTKAITLTGNGVHKRAGVHHKNCIRCYCCHEMCPHDAIVLDRSLLHRRLVK